MKINASLRTLMRRSWSREDRRILEVAAEMREIKSVMRSLSIVRNVLMIFFHFEACSMGMVKKAFSLKESYTSLLQALLLPGTLTSSRSISRTSLSEIECLTVRKIARGG